MAAKRAAARPPRLPLGPFLGDRLPSRRRTSKGVEVVRHMVPLWRLEGVEDELQGLVRTWIGAEQARLEGNSR